MLLNIGRIYWKLGNYREAETWLQEALALARTTEPSSLLCEIDKILAALYCDRADYATAKAHAQEGLSIARRLGDRELIAGLLINLACSLGGPPSSEKRTIYEEALGIAREIKSEELTCLALIHLANIYMENDLPQAEAHLREAGEIASRLHHREWNSMALTNLIKV